MVYPDLKDIQNRTRGSWNVDGLADLVIGAYWIVAGGLWLIGSNLPGHSWGRAVFWIVVPLMLMATGFGSRWMVTKMKERISYPRTGYVAFVGPGKIAWFVSTLLSLLALAGMITLILSGEDFHLERIISPGVGFLLCLFWAIMALRQRTRRFFLFSGMALFMGLLVHFGELGYDGLNWTFVVLGCACVAAGAWQLRRFLRSNPHPGEIPS